MHFTGVSLLAMALSPGHLCKTDEFDLKEGFMELLLSKARLCAARETVRFKTDFLLAKKSLEWFCFFFFLQ